MKCVVCEKLVESEVIIAKHEVSFCSQTCLDKYEVKLEELSKVVNWDNCC